MSYRMVCDFCQTPFTILDEVEELYHNKEMKRSWSSAFRKPSIETWHIHDHCLRAFKDAMKEAHHGEQVLDKIPRKPAPDGWPKQLPFPPKPGYW